MTVDRFWLGLCQISSRSGDRLDARRQLLVGLDHHRNEVMSHIGCQSENLLDIVCLARRRHLVVTRYYNLGIDVLKISAFDTESGVVPGSLKVTCNPLPSKTCPKFVPGFALRCALS
jgi:hypothetical protein